MFSARAGDLRAAAGDRRVAPHGSCRRCAPTTRAASREPLHHLERELFESDLEPAPLFGPASAPTVDPCAAIELLRGGGPRAEAELVAATVARLLRDEGYAPEEVAVIVRRAETGPPVARALREARDRRSRSTSASPRAAPRWGAA